MELGALAVAALSLTGCVTDNPPTSSLSTAHTYPVTRKTNVVDDYNGAKVPDPYRWLEDDNSPETKAWVDAQNQITSAYLQSIPELPAIRARLTKLWNYERYGVPFKEGARYFFTKNDGLQNQSVLFTMPSLDAPPTVLLDPNKLSADGTVALASYSISNDGNWMAYALATAGSDWREWRVRDVRTGQDLSDLVKWSRFSSASWTKDGKGFFYSRFDEPQKENEFKGTLFFQKLYYHRLGTQQSEDELVYHRPDQKEWGFDGGVTDDGRYLIITITQGTDTRNRVFYKNLQNLGETVVELLADFDAERREFTVPFVLSELATPAARHRAETLTTVLGKPFLMPPDVALRIFLEDTDDILGAEPARITIHGITDNPPSIAAELKGIG